MSRTIREFQVSSKKPEEVKQYIANWFSENYFEVREWASKGKRLWVHKWFLFLGIKLSPQAGSIVAIRTDISGCIAFEIILRESGNSTLVHGEFYAPGSSIFLGSEWDLRERSPLAGKWPREEGYILMTKFIQSLEDFSLVSTEPKS
jgi:hypothetical protein